MIGANDVFIEQAHTDKDVKTVVSKISKPVSILISNLQKDQAKTILLVGMRSIQEAQLAAQQQEKNNIKNYVAWIQKTALRLNDSLAALAHEKNVLYFDAYAFDQQQIKKMKKIECYKNYGNYFSGQSPECADPEKHFFWDRIHPSTAAHSAMANAVNQAFFEKK
jgi:cholinesterase